MSKKAVRDLMAGDVVRLADGGTATVERVWREAIFDGDVWNVIHSEGNTIADGGDVVRLATPARGDDGGEG